MLFSYISKCGWRALDSRHKTSVDVVVTSGKSWGICQNVKNWVAGGNWEVCGTTRDVRVPLWAEELPQQRARVGGKHKTKVDNVQAPHVETRAHLFTNCLPFSLKDIGIHEDYFMLDFWRVFNVIGAFLFRTLWRRKLTILRKPNRGTRGTNMMWTVTMKRRDIWTWSNSWKRRNHGWWVGQIECCGGCLQSRWKKQSFSISFFPGVWDHPQGDWECEKGARWSKKESLCPQTFPGTHDAEDQGDKRAAAAYWGSSEVQG